MNQGIIGIIIALLVILAGVVYWMNSSGTPVDVISSPVVNVFPGSASSTGGEGDSSGATSTLGAVKSIAVEGKNYSFSPSSITVKRGEKVEIRLTSIQGTHSLTIDELGVASNTVNTGETTSVEFTPQTAGVYEFYCPIGNHRAMGMKGNIRVE